MKKDLVYIIIILLLIGGAFAGKQYYEDKLDKRDLAYKDLVLENDVLTKVNETQYTKLVDDTKTIKDLEERVEWLGFELIKKPKVIYETIIEYEPVEKPIDDVEVEDGILTINDFYPSKEDPFIEYTTKYNFELDEGISNWKLNPTNISIIISQRDDGIWKSDIKVPEYMKVGEVTINAVPLDIPEIDKFGWLLGVSYGKNFESDSEFLRVSGGARIGKTYIKLGATTIQTMDLGVEFEF